MISGLLELLQSRWNTQWLHWARQLADVLIEQFEDTSAGGFFFTSHDHEQLIQRTKSYSDDATPSGNGLAAESLLLLGYLLAEPRYLEAAERCLKAAWSSINQAAISHCSLLEALDMHLDPPQIVILRGDEDALAAWLEPAIGAYLPRCYLFAIPQDDALPPGLADKALSDSVQAYVCEGTHCLPPISSADEWHARIRDSIAALDQSRQPAPHRG